MRLTVVFAVAVVLATSAGSAGAQVQDPPAVAPAIADGSAQTALDAARARWKRVGPRSYSEEIRLTCCCVPLPRWVPIVVGGGVPTRATQRRTGELATVPRQFRLVQQAIDARLSGLTVRYGDRGQPTLIAFDPLDFVSDDEATYAFRRFTRR